MYYSKTKYYCNIMLKVLLNDIVAIGSREKRQPSLYLIPTRSDREEALSTVRTFTPARKLPHFLHSCNHSKFFISRSRQARNHLKEIISVLSLFMRSRTPVDLSDRCIHSEFFIHNYAVFALLYEIQTVPMQAQQQNSSILTTK